MRDKFIYTVQLRIPAGYDIPATIENVKRFPAFDRLGNIGGKAGLSVFNFSL
jgi:hypothetical protein